MTAMFFNFIYLFLERREGKEERNINVREKHWLVASCMYPNQGRTHNLGMCPDWELNLGLSVCRVTPNQLSHTGRGGNHCYVVPPVLRSVAGLLSLQLSESSLLCFIYSVKVLVVLSRKNREKYIYFIVTVTSICSWYSLSYKSAGHPLDWLPAEQPSTKE